MIPILLRINGQEVGKYKLGKEEEEYDLCRSLSCHFPSPLLDTLIWMIPYNEP